MVKRFIKITTTVKSRDDIWDGEKKKKLFLQIKPN